MTSLIQSSVFDRIFNAPLLGQIGSIKKFALSRSKQHLRTRFRTKKNRIDRGELLQQLDVCYEELSVAIMAELEDRERVNKELREKVHSQLETARVLVDNFNGPPAHKKLFDTQLSKFENLVKDPNKRLKSDTLRKLIDSAEILINKTKIKSEPEDAPSSSKPETAVTSTTASTAEPTAPETPPQVSTCVPDSTRETVLDKSVTPPPKVVAPAAEKEVTKVSQPILVREIISEQAKLTQKAQIPWRRPTRLEPLKAKKEKSVEKFIIPLKKKEPERLALKYKTKKKKRPAEDDLCVESQFKKPFPMPGGSDHPQKPLFQRRHQLPPTAAPAHSSRDQRFYNNSRDPRSYADYCHRQTIIHQNRARFESQNQQYCKQRPPAPIVHKPAAPAHHFAVPTPLPPTKPVPRPPAPRAAVPPTVTKPVPPKPAPAPKIDIKRTINPVYSNNDMIPLGKKETPKKISPSKPPAAPEQPKEDTPTKVLEEEKIEQTKVPSKKHEEQSAKQPEEPKVETPKVKEPSTDSSGEKKQPVQNDLMNLLSKIGDEKKVKQILDVMKGKSDDEAEDKKKSATKEADATAKVKTAEKKTKKYKRILSKPEESSSEDEPAKKDDSKKEKSKSTKRGSTGSRELIRLIENSSDFMSKGGELNTRRRTQVAINASPTSKQFRSGNQRDGEETSSSDEEPLSVETTPQPEQEESLLTVAKSPPTKGKQKAKEARFVYNDKKTVHCNSNYSSNCALCSFNGSAIVDHYVYEHKQYEVFISRVSQKVAEIIRTDPFLTNGALLREEGENEKIRFKCYFCLASKELSVAGWTEHMASHTGEYRYRCTSCPVMSQTEELSSSFFHEKSCLKPSLAVYNNIEFQDNHVYGFICNACNYIQIRRVNMERHLKREHPSADVTCTRFSIINYKVETRPIVDEDQLMADLSSPLIPTVMIPLQPKGEPLDACEIVNQPFTEDEEMPEAESSLASLARRTDFRLESVHVGSAGDYNQLGHRPFSFKMEQELQGDQISSSGGFYESPMSPEPPTGNELSEAEAVIPVLQIQSVQGGFSLDKVFMKPERNDDYDSDASDKTTDFDMSDATEEGRQTNESGQKRTDDSSDAGSSGDSGAPPAGGDGAAPSSGSDSGAGGAAGSGGDGGDDRKKEEFPIPVKIKVEKDDEEKEKKKSEDDEQAALGNAVVKTEKTAESSDEPPAAEGDFDFVELVLDSTRIEHVAFIEHKSEILYLCLMPGCKYISKKSSDFVSHVAKKHSQVTWDGYCHPCQSQIVIMDNCLISNELQHLLDVHARRKTPTIETPDVRATTPSVLRIRKMPGDTLSTVDPNPPPLAPILPAAPPIIAGTSTMTMGQPPILIQATTTMQSMPVCTNAMIPPTHTIPAQIRPISQNIGSTVITTSAPPALAPVMGTSQVPSLANLRLNTVRLKPWTNMVTTKNQEHCRSMLEEISLLCLYKCMARQCAFTTSNKFFMEQHLSLHESLHVGGANAPRKCWLECAYCDLIAANTVTLLTHIDAEHATCGFQCNLCFYRSRDPTNVVVHQKTYHPTGSQPKKILIMPDNLKSFGDDEWRSMQESLRRNVLPLHCTICKNSYYILSAYMNHLATHDQDLVCCQVCNLNIEKKSMARHLLLHSIGLYECVYCLFGANTKSTMALHVSNSHSSKPLYCCVRYNKKKPDGLEYPPSKIESMELKTMSCTVSPDLFKRCNYTIAQLNYKPVDILSNQTLSYQTQTTAKVASSTVAIPSTSTTTTNPAANIQIQITDEAGRPLIISIPVQNSTAKSTAPPPTICTNMSTMQATITTVPTIQMPMISTVQGGVHSMSQPAPLPIISSVQGMAPLPPLTAIQRNDGLPIISSVQSMAQLPSANEHSNTPPAVQQPPTLTTINPSGVMMTLPSIPGITITKTITTCVASSSTTVSSTQTISEMRPIISSVESISTVPSNSKSTNDLYTTTVAEADTQSNYTDGGFVESDSDEVKAGSSKSSNSNTPVPSQSPAPPAPPATPVTPGTPAPPAAPQPGSSKEAGATKKFSSTTQIRIDFLFNGSVEKFDRLEKKVSEMIKHTGFCGQELNVCGVDKCNNRFTDPVKLNLHLLKHHNVSKYTCHHCAERFKTAHELITHIKTHGRHRYLCFLCDRKSHFLKMMILHVQHDHNSTDVILTYLHPKKRDIHNDLVVICPQNVTGAQLQSYVDNILKDDSVIEKKIFAPSEVAQLPLEEIFPEDMFCGACDYTTKIRKNLKRHLDRHSDPLAAAKPAAETAPPVEPPIMIASPEVALSPSIPQKVDPMKLYQCGICKYECTPLLGDFRTHLYRTHRNRNEKVYNCSHCSVTLNDGFICIDKIVNHLKLHGENLYKCSECDYCRDEKYLISAHVKKNHGPTAGIVILREPNLKYAVQPEWQCDLCETIRQTRAEMEDHMTTDHKLTNKQYKCSLCSYKSSENDSFKSHFSSTHPKSDILIISLFHELPPKKIAPLKLDTSSSSDKDVTTDGVKKKRYACGHESCNYSSSDLEWTKKHFVTSHPDSTLIVLDETAVDKETRKRFDYFVKYVCNYCQLQCDTVDDVVEHWNNKHKKEANGKPLMFKLFKLVRCFYCDKLSTYYDIKMHATVNHPGQTFACVDHQNVFKCGECPYVVLANKIDLLKHFKIYHSASKGEDPCDYIDDEFLHRMLEQNNSMYTCNHCKVTYDSRFEYENHIETCAFAGMPSSFKLTPKSVRIRYICSCCNDMFNNEYAIAKHMRSHLTQYNCRYCKREFKQLKHLNQHQILLHDAQDNEFVLKDLNQYRNVFLKIKMLFPNGLLLSKVDAYRTVCGSVEDIINYARSVNSEEMRDLLYSRAIEMPLEYEDSAGEKVVTTCKDYLDTQPSMILQLQDLTEEQVEEIKEQVYLLAKASSTAESSAKRKRGRPRRGKRIAASNTDTDDENDDDWKPERKRAAFTRMPMKLIRRELAPNSSSESDDELLINFKKENGE